MVEYCSKCNGNKKYKGTGYMMVTCDSCKGTGIKINKEQPKTESVEMKPRRGRPKKDNENDQGR